MIHACYSIVRSRKQHSTERGAAITFQKKVYWLGTFDSIKDAANARKEAENHLYGDFLEWYAETYPNAKKNIKNREKKASGKD